MSTTEHSIDEQETPLDPDEPETPTWFTFLGVGLFLLGGIFLLATSGDEQPAAAAESAAAPVDEAPGAAPAAAPDAVAPGAAAPSAAAPRAAAPSAPADPHAGHGHD